MTARILLICAALPLAAFAQLQLFTFDGTSEKQVTALTDFGSVPAGDSREVRFRARNNGAAAVAVTILTLSGQGFNVSAAPSLPAVVAPTNFTEIRVRFSASSLGSYSATFVVNNMQTILRVVVVPTATVSVLNNAVGALLGSGATIDFGRVQKGKSAAQDVRIANGNTAALDIQTCGITGTAFHAPDLHCPMSLQPGAAVIVRVSFDPTSAGAAQGALSIDSRTFTLAAVGFDPPLPKPSISFSSPLTSGVQQRLAVRLAAASESSGSGTVSMDFQPVSGAGDDPAIRFTNSGARALSFQVREGDDAGTFPAGVDTMFQTGTTAGTLIFRVKLGDYDEQFAFAIAPAAVALDHATGTRRSGDLDVSITGFDNTRSTGRFSFTFYDAAGKQIQPGAVRADWSELFSNYFKVSKVGGSFTMRATFPVSGDASLIGGVEVEMTNSAGTTRTNRLTF